MRVILLVAIACLCGMSFYWQKARHPSIYPSRRVLRSRARNMGVSGVFLLFLWVIWNWIH